MEPFELVVPCELSHLSFVRHELASWLADSPASDEVALDVVLAAHEAVANAMEHAGERADVLVEAHLDDSELTVEVTDRGTWRHSRDGDLDERGRGLHVVSALARRLEIDAAPGGTTIRMGFAVAPPAV